MRSNLVGRMFSLMLILMLGITVTLTMPPMAMAQRAPAQAFNPRDISGYWDLTVPAGSPNALSNNRPPMTPWGTEQFRKVRSEFSAAALGNKISAPKAEWNDPLAVCDPPGFPRMLWLPKTPGTRLLVTNDEVYQFFEFARTWRELWTDGRKLSTEAEPRWIGYSSARWDGNTLIVDSAGFMEASWLDQYGSPHSDELRVEERYRLVDKDHLELTMSVTDPKTYTAPWVSDKKTFVRVEKTTRSAFNDLSENFCVWSRDRQ